jgi:hypothetical protein
MKYLLGLKERDNECKGRFDVLLDFIFEGHKIIVAMVLSWVYIISNTGAIKPKTPKERDHDNQPD